MKSFTTQNERGMKLVVQPVPGSILAFYEALRQSESLEQAAAWPYMDKHL